MLTKCQKHNARILIVEDEFVIAESMNLTLTNLRYNVIGTVNNGADAIEKAKIERPDIVLMDITLSGDMDGIEAAAHINFNYHIPVIFITAHVDEALLERAKITEPFGYLLKPIEEKILHYTIEIALYKDMIDKKFTAQEIYYQEIINNISYPMMVIGHDYRIKMMNNVLRKQVPLTYTKYGDFFCYQISHHRDEPCIGKNCPLEYVRTTFKSQTITHQHFTKDGQVRYVEVMASPLLKEDGSFDSIVESHIDVTDRINSEEKLKKQREQFISVLIDGLKERVITISGFSKKLMSNMIDNELEKIEGYKMINEASDEILEIIDYTSKNIKGKISIE